MRQSATHTGNNRFKSFVHARVTNLGVLVRTISSTLFILHMATVTYAMDYNFTSTWPEQNAPFYTDPSPPYYVNNLWEAIEIGLPANAIYSLAQLGAPLWYQRSLQRGGFIGVLHVAVELGDIAAVDALLNFKPELAKLADFRNWTPALYAKKLANNPLRLLFRLNKELMSKNNSEARLRKIIEMGRKAGIPDDFYLSTSIFHRAAFYGKKDFIKVLLEVNPKLGFQADFNGHTAYEYALTTNDQEIMSLLPQFVPTLSMEEKLAHVAFLAAVASGDEDAVLEKIDSIKHLKFARSEGGYDPLQLAIASFVTSDIIKLLFIHKLFKEESASSIYHFAVMVNNLKALKALRAVDKAFQQNITMRDQSGSTPAELARTLGRDFAGIALYLEQATVPEEPSIFDSIVKTIFSS